MITLKNKEVNIIGAGLAGCEAALYLDEKGIKVNLYEMKSIKKTPAQKSENLGAKKEEQGSTEIVSGKFAPPIHPVQTAKAASEAIVKMGAEKLDKFSERVGKIMKKK